MLLAIDTATRTISLALYDGHQVVAEATWRTANHHTVELAPAVVSMLGEAKLSPRDLQAVAVALGPGSFTGLRIGLGVAKGLALANPETALIGVPTLDVVAAAQGPPVNGERLCALLQAGRGRLAVAFYEWGAHWKAAGEPFIATWERLAGQIGGKSTRVSGEIDQKGREALLEGGVTAIVGGAATLRRAGFLAELGWNRLERGEIDDPATLSPLYLHQPEGSAP